MYHCHILEHEDHDTMRPFGVMPAELMLHGHARRRVTRIGLIRHPPRVRLRDAAREVDRWNTTPVTPTGML
jgi:hypothetical protein